MRRFVPAICGVLAAQLHAASPQLDAINPPGAQRGAETELTITGQRLGDAKGLLFYSPGFEVESIEPVDNGKFKTKLKVTADCVLGEHAVRIWTATGASDLTTFYVSPFPNISEAEPNNDAAHAQPIQLNTTVNGVIKEEDIDCFAVEAKKGQRLTAEVEGMRLGKTMFDPWLSISTKDGHELAKNDDNALFQQDPLVSIVAPEDGTYLVAVRESTWGGGEKCAYRLHVGTFPQPLAVYPPGGQTGQELALNLIGDVAGNLTTNVKLPSQPDEKFPVFAEQEGVVAPAANTIRVSPFPNVLEVEPNDDAAHATVASQPLPIACNGVIEKNGDRDFFKFTAKKDQQLDLNVYARRLRSPLDSVLTIHDEHGKELARNDDNGSPDSYLRFKVPADGDYEIAVCDQLKRGGPTFTYRVEITPTAPDVALTIPQIVKDTQERQTVVVPRGNRYGAIMRAKRSEFGGDLTLAPQDLPAGVTVQADAMSEKVDTLPLVFEAAPDAAVTGKLCDVTAQPTDAAKKAGSHFSQHVELVTGPPNNTMYFTTDVGMLPVVVAEPAAFKIETVPPKVPLVQNGAMNLRVVATRDAGFKGEINVSMLWNPPGVNAQPTVKIPEGQSEVTIPLSAADNAMLHKWKTAVVAAADAGKGQTWVSSPLFDLEIAKPFVSAKVVRASTEQGQPATVTCRLTQTTPFEGKAKVQLLGLPNKVTAPDVEITAADEEVKFEVTTAADSPVGQHKGLFCQITLEKDGEKIVSNGPSGGVLRIDRPAEKKEVATK